MARSTLYRDDKVICVNGDTRLKMDDTIVCYRYKMWLFRVNPRFLLPNFRTEHQKNIFVDEVKMGSGELRRGLIPLPRYLRPEGIVQSGFRYFIRRHLGLLCRNYEKGYYNIKLGKNSYIVTKNVAESGNISCEVFYKPTGRLLGNFIFLKDFDEILCRPEREKFLDVFTILVGYVADTIIYKLASAHLNKVIKIK